MKRLVLVVRVALAAVLLATAVGCSFGNDDEEASDRPFPNADFVTALIRPGQEEAGVDYGSVGLTAERGSRTRIAIALTDATAAAESVEVRTGNCDVIGGGVVYSLRPLKQGRSETVVTVPLRDLRKSGYLVMIPDRAGQVGGLCGDLAKSHPPSAAPTYDS